MNSDVETQRLLEQKALRNVRALVEQVELEDRNRSVEAVSIATRLLPLVLVALVALGALMIFFKPKLERPAEVAETKTTAEYVERAISTIERNANGKLRGGLKGLNGRVALRIEVQPDGRAGGIEVIQSAWDASIDREASRIVKLSEPFGPLPQTHSGPLYITGVFNFQSAAGSAGSLVVERETSPSAK